MSVLEDRRASARGLPARPRTRCDAHYPFMFPTAALRKRGRELIRRTGHGLSRAARERESYRPRATSHRRSVSPDESREPSGEFSPREARAGVSSSYPVSALKHVKPSRTPYPRPTLILKALPQPPPPLSSYRLSRPEILSRIHAQATQARTKSQKPRPLENLSCVRNAY